MPLLIRGSRKNRFSTFFEMDIIEIALYDWFQNFSCSCRDNTCLCYARLELETVVNNSVVSKIGYVSICGFFQSHGLKIKTMALGLSGFYNKMSLGELIQCSPLQHKDVRFFFFRVQGMLTDSCLYY